MNRKANRLLRTLRLLAPGAQLLATHVLRLRRPSLHVKIRVLQLTGQVLLVGQVQPGSQIKQLCHHPDHYHLFLEWRTAILRPLHRLRRHILVLDVTAGTLVQWRPDRSPAPSCAKP